MLRDAFIIFRKEVKNVSKDRRAIFSNYLLPFLLMPAMFLGITYFENLQSSDLQEQVYSIGIVNADGPAFSRLLAETIDFTAPDAPAPVPGSDPADLGSVDIWVVFPEGFAAGDRAAVEIYASSTSTDQRYAAEIIRRSVQQYTRGISDMRLAELGLSMDELESLQVIAVDTAPVESQGANFLALFLPYAIIVYLFAGSMSMGIDTTAGEKERGSFSALLVNQISRSSIALGKILFVVTSSLLNAAMSFAGLLLAFSLSSVLLGGGVFSGTVTLSPLSIVSLLLVLLSGAGLAATVIVMLGSMAGSMKEAQGYIGPIYILVILTGVITMSMDPASSLSLYAVPVLNLIFSIKAILLSQASIQALLITVSVNLLIVIALTWLTSRIYNSERILGKS
jgi:sodium transport system permease protein